MIILLLCVDDMLIAGRDTHAFRWSKVFMTALIWRILVMQITSLACKYSEIGWKDYSLYLNRSMSARLCSVSIWRGWKELRFLCLRMWNSMQKTVLHLMIKGWNGQDSICLAVGSLMYAMVAIRPGIAFEWLAGTWQTLEKSFGKKWKVLRDALLITWYDFQIWQWCNSYISIGSMQSSELSTSKLHKEFCTIDTLL